MAARSPNIADELRRLFPDDWLPSIYKTRIRSQRTRKLTINVPASENLAEIQYTLLGIELKVGRRRFACPDLASARYMRIFARLGCSEFALPYDITCISPAADELETAWQVTLLRLGELTRERPHRAVSLARSRLCKAVRQELVEIGPGDAMPLFNKETRFLRKEK